MRTLVFILRNERFAIPLENVREVAEPCPMARIPTARPPLLGAMSIRGKVVAAVDPGPFLGTGGQRGEGPMDGDASAKGSRYVILEHGNASMALRVDRVDSICDATPEPLEHVDPKAPALSATIRLCSGETAGVVDMERLLEAVRRMTGAMERAAGPMAG